MVQARRQESEVDSRVIGAPLNDAPYDFGDVLNKTIDPYSEDGAELNPLDQDGYIGVDPIYQNSGQEINEPIGDPDVFDGQLTDKEQKAADKAADDADDDSGQGGGQVPGAPAVPSTTPPDNPQS